jgi:hypothetical protein
LSKKKKKRERKEEIHTRHLVWNGRTLKVIQAETEKQVTCKGAAGLLQAPWW